MYKKIIIFVVLLSIALLPNLVFAQLTGQVLEQIDKGASTAGFDDYGTDTPPQLIITKAITIVLSLIGIVFVSLIIYGGYKYLTSRGNEEEAQKGLKIVRPAIMGLIVILIAYSITTFIGARFAQIVTTEGVLIK